MAWQDRTLGEILSQEDVSSITAALRSLGTSSSQDASYIRIALLSRFGVSVDAFEGQMDELAHLHWTPAQTSLGDWDLTRPLTHRLRGDGQNVSARIDAHTHRRVSELVGSQAHPEYRTTSDFILSSLRHNLFRCAYLDSYGGTGADEIDEMNAEYEMEREKARTNRFKSDKAQYRAWVEEYETFVNEVADANPQEAEKLVCELITRIQTLLYRQQVHRAVIPQTNQWLDKICSGSDQRTTCRAQALLDAQNIPLSVEESIETHHMEE